MRINKLRILSNDIIAQQRFYAGALGCQVSACEDVLSVHLGDSIIDFVQSESARPFHFAVNIVPAQLDSAYEWLKSRVDLLPDGINQIISFEAWKARAMYFYDADKNIVEFIARQALKKPHQSTVFDISKVIGLSEVALVSNDSMCFAERIEQQLALNTFHTCSDSFCAKGNDEGLFICINPTLKKWFPTMEQAFPAPFSAQVVIDKHIFEVKYEKEELVINKADLLAL